MKEQSFSTKKMTIAIFSAVSFVTIIFYLMIFMNTRSMLMLLAAMLYTTLVIVFLWGYILYMRKMITRFTDRICNTIEDMVQGEESLILHTAEETLLSRIYHRLSKLYRILEENRKLASKEKHMLQELISDISHQVKTPVANLKMVNTTLIERKLTDDKRREFLEAAAGQLDKLDFLMQSMIKTSRLETGMFTLKKKVQSIQETIAAILYDVMMQAEKKNILINIQCDAHIQVAHDRKWTGEAVSNLLENAVKYTPNDGNVDIAVDVEEMYTKIKISDTGKGIPEENYPKIFQRFYREPEVHDTEGIGVGLFLAREIISLQGGYITVDSQKSKGSTFTIGLPNHEISVLS